MVSTDLRCEEAVSCYMIEVKKPITSGFPIIALVIGLSFVVIFLS